MHTSLAQKEHFLQKNREILSKKSKQVVSKNNHSFQQKSIEIVFEDQSAFVSNSIENSSWHCVRALLSL